MRKPVTNILIPFVYLSVINLARFLNENSTKFLVRKFDRF